MTDDDPQAVPVWSIATRPESAATAIAGTALTPARLHELRTALAAFADAPVVTLEAHPLPAKIDRSSGILLESMSPLAQQLAKLVSDAARAVPAVSRIEAGGETLYRMVVPAKVAAQMGKGLVKPMTSKAVSSGIHSALRDATGIAAQATFVPVEAAMAGAAGGAAGTAGAAAAGAGALTVAAPLVLMAVAVGVSAYADHQRQQTIDHIAELVAQLHADNLASERRELDGCRDAIDKATAILLDEGKIGASLGLDSAVHAISKATETANHRLRKWRSALEGLPTGQVEIERLAHDFPGVGGDGGEFRAHLELAALAITLRRRVLVLQAVEHSQSNGSNPFENFVRSLKADQKRVDELEAGIADVLRRLSSIELRSPSRVLDKLMTRGQVDDLLKASYRLRAFRAELDQDGPAPDMVIDMVRSRDGSVLVLPATTQRVA